MLRDTDAAVADTDVLSFIFNRDPIRAPRYDAQRSGHIIERQDAWIAATAIHLGVPLVTHNEAHFAHIPVLTVISCPDAQS